MGNWDKQFQYPPFHFCFSFQPVQATEKGTHGGSTRGCHRRGSMSLRDRKRAALKFMIARMHEDMDDEEEEIEDI